MRTSDATVAGTDPSILLSWPARQRAAFAVLAPYLLLGVLPVLFWFTLVPGLPGNEGAAYDFHHFFYPQARELLDGHVPITAYPPLTTLLYAPFAMLPRELADLAITAAMVACAGATLMILGVRDWRCFGAAALWSPVYGAARTADLSLALALCVATLWRSRDRPAPAGGLVAFTVATKLFLWPLAGWLAATRRLRAVVMMVALGALASAAAWAVVGFDRVARLPALVRGNVMDNGSMPYTIVTILQDLGAPAGLRYATCWAVGAAILFLAARAGRKGLEAASLILFLGAALVLSPIVWAHYLALLLVPVALVRPHFSPLWLAPLPLIVCPAIDPTLAQKLWMLTVAGAIFAFCARECMRPAPSEPAVVATA
jgi:hypothetical protein